MKLGAVVKIAVQGVGHLHKMTQNEHVKLARCRVEGVMANGEHDVAGVDLGYCSF